MCSSGLILQLIKTNNQFDGVGVDDIEIMEAPVDIDMLEILAPVSSCDLSPVQTFTLRMRNTGLSTIPAGDSLQIGYRYCVRVISRLPKKP